MLLCALFAGESLLLNTLCPNGRSDGVTLSRRVPYDARARRPVRPNNSVLSLLTETASKIV